MYVLTPIQDVLIKYLIAKPLHLVYTRRPGGMRHDNLLVLYGFGTSCCAASRVDKIFDYNGF